MKDTINFLNESVFYEIPHFSLYILVAYLENFSKYYNEVYFSTFRVTRLKSYNTVIADREDHILDPWNYSRHMESGGAIGRNKDRRDMPIP